MWSLSGYCICALIITWVYPDGCSENKQNENGAVYHAGAISADIHLGFFAQLFLPVMQQESAGSC